MMTLYARKGPRRRWQRVAVQYSAAEVTESWTEATEASLRAFAAACFPGWETKIICGEG